MGTLMNRRAFLILAACAASLTSLSARAADTPTGFLNRVIEADGKSIPYVVYVPKDFSPEKKWPVILFLHGSGERGTDGLKQSQVGIGTALRLYPERYPAVVVMPQCAPNAGWRGDMNGLALTALDKTIEEVNGDRSRQYLTGLSMGGFGSWSIATADPTRFAAVVPICGGGEPGKASALKDLPIWVFHGDADQSVPVQRSRDMVEAIKAAGGTLVKYTELPGVPHNSWDAAYSDKAMAEWLFAQKR
jgi:predicted peptidase